jgi:AraC-like DNA-binding protein
MSPESAREPAPPSALKHELLGPLEMSVLAIQRTNARQWWNFRSVISPFARLWLILDGQGTVRHHGQEFTLKPGQMHLVPPFVSHDCRCARHLDHYHLHFTVRLPTWIDLFSLLDHSFQLPAPKGAQDHFRRLESLCPELKLPCFDPAREEYRRYPTVAEKAGHELPAVDQFEARGILTLLLAPFLRTARPHEGRHARVSRQFLAVQEFIQAHMRERILLADLARAARLHPTYFSDRFQALVGIRPLGYLMQRRLERAQYLLLTSRLSIKQIAAEVGIPDAAYFTRAFTRGCRVSPSRYREAHRA